jgi:peptidase S24-like protein
MEPEAQRAALAAVMEEQGRSFAELSRVIRRNPAYLQQYLRRGTPRTLAEADRGRLARYLGVPEARLGGPAAHGLIGVARLDIVASAGPGRLVDSEAQRRPGTFSPALLRELGVDPEAASIIRVEGDSMVPLLEHGDEILVDRARRRVTPKGGIFVLRIDGELMVKRLRPTVGGIEVVSENPAYPVRLFASKALEVIGQVAWLSRALV